MGEGQGVVNCVISPSCESDSIVRLKPYCGSLDRVRDSMSNGEKFEFRTRSHASSGGFSFPHFPHIPKTLHDGLRPRMVKPNPMFKIIVEPYSKFMSSNSSY